MTQEEAARLNFGRMIKNIEFMMEISRMKEDELPELPFNYINYPLALMNSRDAKTHKTFSRIDGEIVSETFYVQSTMPRIGSYMYGNTEHLASFETFHLGMVRSPRINQISIGYFSPNEWTIKIETMSSEFIIKDSKGRTNTLDLADEAAVFQYCMIDTETPEFLYDIAMQSLHLLLLSEHVDKVLLKSSGCIVDLEILDLRKQFGIKE